MNRFLKSKKAILMKLSVMTLLLVSAWSPVNASLERNMEAAFNAEMNVTGPTAYLGARRGAITGGKLRVANKISQVRLVTFTPPGIKAGCGGIDIWGGSLSFLSPEAIQGLARNIMSNITGYAVHLALAKFPDGNAALKYLQQELSKTNWNNINSCEMAKDLVNGAMRQVNELKTTAASSNVKNGKTSDYSKAKNVENPIAKVSEQELKTEQVYRANPVYSALNEAGVNSWFPHSGGNFTEAMMSLTGAVILKKDGDNIKPQKYPAILDINHLVYGGTNVPIYRCGGSDCDSISTSEVNLRGLNSMIMDSLLGGNGKIGIIDRFYDGTQKFTAEEQKFIAALSPNVGGIIRELSTNPATAKEFAKQAATIAAFETACSFGRDTIMSVEQSLSVASWGTVAVEDVKDAKTDFLRACDVARMNFAQLNNLFALSQSLKSMIKKEN